MAGLTQRQLERNVNKIITQATKHMRESVRRKITSGCIDLESCSEFTEAKAILCSLLRDEVNQWRTLRGMESPLEKNLMHF